MKKLYKCVCSKIDEIVERGITLNNLKALGELVDIAKDIENIWYWRYKTKAMPDSDAKEDSATDVVYMIGEVMKLSERVANSDSPEDKRLLTNKVMELYAVADNIRTALKSAKGVDDDVNAKIHRMYR